MMYKFKQYSLLFGFLVLFVGLGFFSLIGGFDHYGEEVIKRMNTKRSPEDSYFKEVWHFKLINESPVFQIQSKELVIDENYSLFDAYHLKGFYYSNQNPDPIVFQSDKARAYAEDSKLKLQENVFVSTGKHEFKSNELLIFDNGKFFNGIGNVQTKSLIKANSGIDADTSTISVFSNIMNYSMPEDSVEYLGSVVGKVERVRKYEESLVFKTDKMNMDGKLGVVNLVGNVNLTKSNYEIWSNRGEIILENYNKKLKYYTLSDDVRMREVSPAKEKPFERKAYAEKLEGWMNERKVVLTGFPKVIQDKDIIKGNKIILRENSESVEIDDANSSMILK